MSERFSLKDHLFNEKSVTHFADLFYTQDSSFPKQLLIKRVLDQFPELELKERITCMRQELEELLPDDYQVALETILQALPPELDPAKTDDDFGDFVLAPLAEFVAINGCSKEHLNQSLSALREMTKRFSAEDAIRYFINDFPKETLEFLQEGAGHENYHVRRLSSEATRPKLPWCIGININYREPLPILDQLFADPTRYVTRSVANHMNDLSKIDSELVVERLQCWEETDKQNQKEMDFITNHSLRTLVKQGYQPSLELLGYPSKPKITISELTIQTPVVTIGESLEFSFTITSQDNQKLMVDYIVHHQTKFGTSEKVFKLKKLDLQKGEMISISKKQPFRVMTTKKLYPGEHKLELQINGNRYLIGSFTLVEAS